MGENSCYRSLSIISPRVNKNWWITTLLTPMPLVWMLCFALILIIPVVSTWNANFPKLNSWKKSYCHEIESNQIISKKKEFRSKQNPCTIIVREIKCLVFYQWQWSNPIDGCVVKKNQVPSFAQVKQSHRRLQIKS